MLARGAVLILVHIAEAMVRKRLGRECPSFSGGRYAEAERAAAADGATIGQSYVLPG